MASTAAPAQADHRVAPQYERMVRGDRPGILDGAVEPDRHGTTHTFATITFAPAPLGAPDCRYTGPGDWRSKLITLALVWIMLGGAALFLIESLLMKLVLLGLAGTKTAVLARIHTVPAR